MPNILAIETSSDACSLALLSNGKEFYFHEIIPKQHTERLLKEIKNILECADTKLSKLDAIGVGCGPGSFTGIRLACSTAQGLAFSNNLKTIQVSSLDVLAHKVYKEFNCEKVISLIDARMKQLYVGEYSYNQDGLLDSKISMISLAKFNCNTANAKTHFVGDGCSLVAPLLNKFSSNVHLNLPNASDLLEICINKLEKMEVLDPSHLLPIYLSGEEQWRKS